MRRRLMMAMEKESEEVKPYRLINSVTLEETSRTITIDTDFDGNAFELDDIVVSVVGNCDQESPNYVSVLINDMYFPNAFKVPKKGLDVTNYGGIIYNNGIVIVADYALGQAGAVSAGNESKTYVKNYLTEKVKKVSAYMVVGSHNFEAGTTLRLYGR